MQGARPLQWKLNLSLGNLYRAQGNRSAAASRFAISRGIAEEGEQVGRSLEVTQSLFTATQGVVHDGSSAAEASQRATEIATRKKPGR